MHDCCYVLKRRIKQRRQAEGASTRCGPCVCSVFPILAVVGLVPYSVNSHTALGITAQVQQRSTADACDEMSVLPSVVCLALVVFRTLGNGRFHARSGSLRVLRRSPWCAVPFVVCLALCGVPCPSWCALPSVVCFALRGCGGSSAF